MEHTGHGGPLSASDGLELPEALVFKALARHVPPHLIERDAGDAAERALLLAHNAIRALMDESALSIDVDPRTLSFMHALREKGPEKQHDGIAT